MQTQHKTFISTTLDVPTNKTINPCPLGSPGSFLPYSRADIGSEALSTGSISILSEESRQFTLRKLAMRARLKGSDYDHFMRTVFIVYFTSET